MDKSHLLKVGLTGGIGSGKSTVAQFFRELGVPVMDSDKIVHQLLIPTHPVFTTVVEHFGKEILEKDGFLNRKKLGEIVFHSPKERLWLESSLHPLVKKEIQRQCDLFAKKSYVIIEIPLLIEAHFQDTVDKILLVDCKEDRQIKRVQKRDGKDVEEIKNILQNQASQETRLQHATDIIHNNKGLEELQKQVEALHQHYRKISTK